MAKRRKSSKKSSIPSVDTVFQPIIEVGTGKIYAYEALSRGRGKFRNPEEMFRDAYEKGYMIDLDLSCMRKAFPNVALVNPRQYMFINVEPVTLCNIFSEWRRIQTILKKVKRRERIVFELTEGIKERDIELAKRGVTYLRKLGCQFALDDVKGIGTKFFELMRLKPDFIKLDISITRSLLESDFNQSIIEHLVELSRKNKAEIVAEGVERVEHVRLVRKLGIQYVQGFYYARPQNTLSPNIRNTSQKKSRRKR